MHSEEALRVPLIIARGGLKGRNSDAFVQLTDLIPTLADLACVPMQAEVEGRSFAHVVQGASTKIRDYIMAETFKWNGEESGKGEYTSLTCFDPQTDSFNLSIWRQRRPRGRFDVHA